MNFPANNIHRSLSGITDSVVIIDDYYQDDKKQQQPIPNTTGSQPTTPTSYTNILPFQVPELKSTATQLTQYGYKFYDYIEKSLGKQNETVTNEKVEEWQIPKSCAECSYDQIALWDTLNNKLLGLRACGVCGNVYCYRHCSFSRRVSSTITRELDPDGVEVKVCKRCFEKGKDQEVGQTKDHTSNFVSIRSKKNNVKEQKQDKILTRLEIISKETRTEPLANNNSSNSSPSSIATYSLWSLQNALVTAITDNSPSSPSSCALCSTQFGFWGTSIQCKLCNNTCCSTCCRYTVPLKKSLLNPNGPPDSSQEIPICTICNSLLGAKKKRIRYANKKISVQNLIKKYAYASDLKREIDKRLADYLSSSQFLESSILDNFEVIGGTTIDLSDSVREKNEDQLEKLAPLYKAYEECVNEILAESPCMLEREKLILKNFKHAFLKSQAKVVLSKAVS